MMKKCLRASAFKMPAAVVLAMAVFSTSVLLAAGPAVREEQGKYFDKDGSPTYDVKEDGTVDWYTYSGFRRYHSECHVCHGPDGLGSTYAPPIADSLKAMSYSDFLDVVVNGREIVRADKTSVMPAFGENQNVMCFIDDLFVYLKARADGVIPRGRPQKRAEKPEDATQYEKSCFGRD
jgi:methanol metabolism-related c-type cytochrome